MKLGTLRLVAMALAIAACAAEAAPRYVATRVPHVDGYNTSADAISASGAIAGNIRTALDYYYDEEDVASFVFSPDNEFVPLVMPAALVPPGAVTRAYGINSRGVVVGTVFAESSLRAFWYADGGADVRLGEAGSAVNAINDDDAIAGHQRGRAFVSSAAGGFYVPRDDSYGVAINERGDIAGYFRSARVGDRVVYHAFRYRDGVFEDLGALEDSAYPSAINVSGVVVGSTRWGNGPRPFVYADGVMRYLGDYPGVASAINAAGTVVGYQYANDYFRTFVYADGAFANLEDLVDNLDGARLMEATAINDAGQIAARACGRGYGAECYGLRLDPVPALR